MLLGNNIVSAIDEYIIFMVCWNNLLVHGPTIPTGVYQILVISLRTAMWFQILALAGGSVTFTRRQAAPRWLFSQEQSEVFVVSGGTSNKLTEDVDFFITTAIGHQ